MGKKKAVVTTGITDLTREGSGYYIN